ncbi:hypothetical protein F3L16_06470 [Morganella morganii subsp. morganii]|nr:hypothetical protein F3L16_06470 [Morganella morganii subsp. morganii]
MLPKMRAQRLRSARRPFFTSLLSSSPSASSSSPSASASSSSSSASGSSSSPSAFLAFFALRPCFSSP